MKNLADIPTTLKSIDWLARADEIGQEVGLPAGIYRALVQVESGGNPKARSAKGAIGLAQLMPATAKELGVNPYNVEENLRGGALYLKKLYDRFQDWGKAFAAYNAGPEAVIKHGGIPPYKETQEYVKKLQSMTESRVDLDSLSTEELLEMLSDDDLRELAGISTAQQTTPSSRATVTQPQAQPAQQEPFNWKKVIADMTQNTLPLAGLLFGGAVGGGTGLATSPATGPLGPIGGSVAGGTLGYATGKKAADVVAELLGVKKVPSAAGQAMETGTAVKEGLENALLGKVGEVAIPPIISKSGSIIKSIWGRLTAKGKIAMEEAIKNSPTFQKALKGDIEPTDIAISIRNALTTHAKNAQKEYVDKLNTIRLDSSTLDDVVKDVKTAMDDLVSDARFNIGITRSPEGKVALDFSKSPLASHRATIKRVIDTVDQWSDTTPAGLDNLKKVIGEYAKAVEERTPTRAFIDTLYGSIRNSLIKKVPGYKDMIQPYEEAMQLIRDVEHGIAGKWHLLSGRGAADKVLRRMMTVLKEDSAASRSLVRDITVGADDVVAQLAGYSMNQWMPGGLGGSGPFLLGQGILMYMNPQLFPVIAASSPKVAAKFLQMYGKVLAANKGMAGPYTQLFNVSLQNSLKERK